VHPRIQAENRPQCAALVMATRGEIVTFDALEQRANRAAHALRGLGLRAGDRLAMVCDNRPDFLDVFWAAQRTGIVLVALSTRLKADEIAYIVNDSSAKALLITDAMRGVASDLVAVRSEMPRLSHVLGIGSLAKLPNWLQRCAEQPSTPIADEYFGSRMAYSSGTTGRPKGIVLPPGSGSPIQPLPGTDMMQGLYGLDQSTVYLCPAPLYHAAPVAFTTSVQAIGGTSVLMEKFDPEEFLRLIERWRVTAVQVVPTMFVRLLKLAPAVRAKYDLSSLRTVIHAAAPCPPEIKRQMIDWLGPIIHEFYGGSEGIGLVGINSEDWLSHPGSVGKALRGVVHICDDAGNELPAGETGLIYFSDGGTFTYHNDPVKTQQARNPLHPDWSTLGDIGRMDTEGYLYLTDRRDFVIISGGVNIYPQEVENLLITHPKVADVAVIGVPNEEFGEEVKAVVQPVSCSEDQERLAAELITWCRERAADVKCPRTIDFTPSLPRADTGKLYKRELIAMYAPQNPHGSLP